MYYENRRVDCLERRVGASDHDVCTDILANLQHKQDMEFDMLLVTVPAKVSHASSVRYHPGLTVIADRLTVYV